MEREGVTDLDVLKRNLSGVVEDTVVLLVVSLNFPEVVDFFWRHIANQRLHFTFGLYPHETSCPYARYPAKRMEQLMGHPRCVGVSEVGLDYPLQPN